MRIDDRLKGTPYRRWPITYARHAEFKCPHVFGRTELKLFSLFLYASACPILQPMQSLKVSKIKTHRVLQRQLSNWLCKRRTRMSTVTT